MDKSEHPRVESSSAPAKKEYRLGILALLVAVGTGGFTYLQYRAAEKAIGVAHDDSMQTMKLSNRPYVSVQGTVDFQGLTTPGQMVAVTLHFTAMGSSPAIDTVLERNCIVSENAAKEENGVRAIGPPPEIWSHLHPAVSHSVLFPQNSIDFHCEAFWQGDPPPFVFVVGDVAYRDVFKDTHKTKFCFETTTRPLAGPRPMLPCSNGNAME